MDKKKLLEEYKKSLAECEGLQKKVKDENRDYTDEERVQIKSALKLCEELRGKIDALTKKEQEDLEIEKKQKELGDYIEKSRGIPEEINATADKNSTTRSKDTNFVEGIELREKDFPDANARIDQQEKIKLFKRMILGDRKAKMELRVLDSGSQGASFVIPEAIQIDLMGRIKKMSILRTLCVTRKFAGTEIEMPMLQAAIAIDVTDGRALTAQNEDMFKNKKLTTKRIGARLDIRINSLPETEVLPHLMNTLSVALYEKEEELNTASLTAQIPSKNKIFTNENLKVKYGDLKKLFTKLQPSARQGSSFLFGMGTEDDLYGLEDTTGQPLWNLIGQATGNTKIFGRSFYTNEAFEDPATKKIAALHGDFNNVAIFQKGEMAMFVPADIGATTYTVPYLVYLESGILITRENAVMALAYK